MFGLISPTGKRNLSFSLEPLLYVLFAMEIINHEMMFIKCLTLTGAMIILHHRPNFIHSFTLDYSFLVSGALIVPLIE